MRTHLFVCGHGYNDPGAIGNGTTEREFTRNVFRAAVNKYANQLKNNKIVWYDIAKDLFQDTANGWGLYGINAKTYASVTEWHLDAASPQATGGHVIINSNFKADNLDLQCGKAIKDVVGWWGSVSNKQGVNGRNNLLNCNVSAQRGINYRLIELGFITSTRDMTIIKRDIDKYAKLFVEAITGEVLSTTPSKPKPKEASYYVEANCYFEIVNVNVYDKPWFTSKTKRKTRLPKTTLVWGREIKYSPEGYPRIKTGLGYISANTRNVIARNSGKPVKTKTKSELKIK